MRLEEREMRGGGGALLHEGFVLWAFQTHLILQVLEMKQLFMGNFLFLFIYFYYIGSCSIVYIIFSICFWVGEKGIFFFWVGGFLTA